MATVVDLFSFSLHLAKIPGYPDMPLDMAELLLAALKSPSLSSLVSGDWKTIISDHKDCR